MPRYRFVCQYRGTNYHGWQRQDDVSSVQQILEDTIGTVLQQSITVHGAGRTDAGVHALGQVSHFDTGSDVGVPKSRWQPLINQRLPDDVRVNTFQLVHGDEFHARHAADRRFYGYRFRHDGDWSLGNSDSYRVMSDDWRPNRARWLVDQYDRGVPTGVFAGEGGSSYETDRWPLRCRLRRRRGEFWMLVSAKSFKYRMVRCLAGTLIRFMGRVRSRSEITELLNGFGETVKPAPAAGCYLLGVRYDDGFGASLEPHGWNRVLQHVC